eukprot:1410526-Rhodomonas_salina.1
MQRSTVSVQTVPGMRRLVFDFGAGWYHRIRLLLLDPLVVVPPVVIPPVLFPVRSHNLPDPHQRLAHVRVA